MVYYKTIPFELEECALIDGASRWQILIQIVLPLAVPGLISAFIFCFTLCWNEFIYALTFISSTSNKTVPVAIVNEFVDGDIYRWGSLMAGALVGSLPLGVLFPLFVEHHVSAMTGGGQEKTNPTSSWLPLGKKRLDPEPCGRENEAAGPEHDGPTGWC